MVLRPFQAVSCAPESVEYNDCRPKEVEEEG